MVCSRLDASRIPVLILVSAAHVGALLVLVTLTRTQTARIASEANPVLIFFPSEEPTPPADALLRRPHRRSPSRARTRRAPPPVRPVSGIATPPEGPSAITAESPATTDWTAEAQAAAMRQLDAARRDRGRAAAFAPPPPNPAFTIRAPKPIFHWDYAHTHRIEAEGGGGIVLNLSDNCAMVLVPFPMFGCALGRSPVRGDLFDHMHDRSD